MLMLGASEKKAKNSIMTILWRTDKIVTDKQQRHGLDCVYGLSKVEVCGVPFKRERV